MESLMSLVGNLPKSHIVLRRGRALAEPQDHILTVGPHYSELGVALISNLTHPQSPLGHHRVQSRNQSKSGGPEMEAHSFSPRLTSNPGL